MKVTEGGEYYFWVKDNNGKAYRSNKIDVRNIDKINPIAGSIIAKIENKDGEDYTFDTWVDKSVYVEKVDGKDNESGHQKTTMTIKKNGVSMGEEYTDREEPVTLTESGVYTVTVTTTDKAGNTATSQEYTIKIDKAIPVLALKHNNATGADYNGEWTKDDLYGEINLTSGRPVKKYQYSYNGVIWNDISEEVIPGSIDYTSKFPLDEDKPDWITQINTTNNSLNSNGKYYFEVQEDGTLKPNNSGVNSTTASSYFEIDLTDYPDSKLNLTLDYTISSENNYDWGYATIVEDGQAVPAYNTTTGRFVYASGTTKTEQKTTEITGGKKYRLYIGYRKDGSGNNNQDTFIINSIRLQSEELGKSINFYNYNKTGNKVTFLLNEDIDKEIYVRAIYEEENISKYGDKTTIKIDKTAPKIDTIKSELVSKTEANATISIIEKGSGMKAYYISAEETEPTENDWVEHNVNVIEFEKLKEGIIYYLWLKDNAGNILERQEIQIASVNYVVDNSFYVETLQTAISKASDGSTIELVKNYTDDSVATIDKNITFTINEYTLTRTETITINSNKTVEITGAGKITSGTSNINTITNNGILTISDKIVIENDSLTLNSYSVINNNFSNSVLNILDSVNISGNYRAINNYGTVNIKEGKIEAKYQGNNAYGIETSGTLNFYDGTINGASAVQGTVTARADGYLIRTTTVNGKERYYLSK